jgi:DNA-directed RNA polymerase specialized sigma24 family protein
MTMLDSFASVERALARYTDPLQPRSASISAVPTARTGGDGAPFHPALLDELEERAELRRRMAWLEEEAAIVLVRWYIEGARPEAIARGLGRSVRHVYRRRADAIRLLVALGTSGEFADADLSEFV